MNMKGYWLVTPTKGKSKKFSTQKLMVEYLKKQKACMVSWIKQ